MINTTASVASLLSQVYQNNNASLNDSFRKISSGKRVQSASDDFAAYLKSSTLGADVKLYNVYKQDLQEAKAHADLAKSTGDQILADLNKLRQLAVQYAATSDTDQQNALNAEYTGIVQEMNDTIAQTYYEGNQVYATATSVAATATIGGQAMTITVKASQVATNGNVDAVDDGAAAIDDEIDAAQKYVAQMKSFGDLIQGQMNLADVAIASHNARISILTDVDEAVEMANVTNMQIRQQATAAMMAQSFNSQAAISRLF